MMRWNSTKTYTEDDILRMQQEAVTRVHEFQSRAKALPFYDVPESAITPYQEPAYETAEPEMPFEAPAEALPPPAEEAALTPEPEAREASLPEPQAPPENMNYSGGMNPMGGMNHMGGMNMTNMPPAQPQPTDPITGILSKLNLDGETLLILGLMFLLYNEKADNVLLIALAYLLL